jgi:hypothetical protein
MILPMGGKHAPLADTVERPTETAAGGASTPSAAIDRLPSPGHRVNLPLVDSQLQRGPTARTRRTKSRTWSRTTIERPFSDP